MLKEAGVMDPNCKCYAGGRPRPDSILPGVTWCTCGPDSRTRETKETLQREAPKTGKLTGSSKGPPKTGETKEPANVIKNKNTDWEKTPSNTRETKKTAPATTTNTKKAIPNLHKELGSLLQAPDPAYNSETNLYSCKPGPENRRTHGRRPDDQATANPTVT